MSALERAAEIWGKAGVVGGTTYAPCTSRAINQLQPKLTPIADITTQARTFFHLTQTSGLPTNSVWGVPDWNSPNNSA